MTDFDSYIRQGEPSRRELASNWSIAIGLQAVDGLTPSAYLIDSARQNIEGQLSLDEVQHRINAYYQSKEGRELEAKNAGKEEADKVAGNITRLLSEQTFALNVPTLANIHRRIFTGVMKHAGEFRQYNISKREWVLDGESVIYAPHELISESLDFDFEQERRFDYAALSEEKRLDHLMRFIAGIWQIHPFAEGNTRTTAIFTIFYLRKFGYRLSNEPFSLYSLFFRNALVRANYENRSAGVTATYEPLKAFFRYALYGEKQELRNRYLHVRSAEILQESPRSNICTLDEKDCTLNEKDCTLNLTLEEQAILKLIADNPRLTQKELAPAIGKSERTVKTLTHQMVEKGIIMRVNGRRNGFWRVIRPTPALPRREGE